MRIYEMTQEKIKAKIEYNMDQSNIGFKGSSFEKEKLSIGSEFAFARQIGLDDITATDAVNNCRYDFKLCDQTIDIKATIYKDARLFVKPEKAFYSDWFLLFCRLDLKNFKFLGAAQKADLVNDNTLGMPRGFRGQVHYLNQDKLKDFSI